MNSYLLHYHRKNAEEQSNATGSLAANLADKFGKELKTDTPKIAAQLDDVIQKTDTPTETLDDNKILGMKPILFYAVALLTIGGLITGIVLLSKKQ